MTDAPIETAAQLHRRIAALLREAVASLEAYAKSQDEAELVRAKDLYDAAAPLMFRLTTNGES